MDDKETIGKQGRMLIWMGALLPTAINGIRTAGANGDGVTLAIGGLSALVGTAMVIMDIIKGGGGGGE